jgi:hypothetical protein
MPIRRELIDELLKDYETPQDILREGGLLKELTKAVIERCLETELDTHLGYQKHGRKGNTTGNTRNGQSQKTLKGEQGHVEIEVPRDRQGSFEPQLVKKGQTRLDGFDDKILALYARGMTTRDIQAQLQELYGVEVSPTLISNVTEAVMDARAPMADASVRASLSDCLCGLSGRQRARAPTRDQQSALPGTCRQSGGTQGTAGDVDGPKRRRQVLVVRADRTPESRSQRYLSCLCGWAQRSARSH